MDENGYNESIIQPNTVRCWLCGRRADKLDRHEVFGGAYRKKSKALGLWVYLCHDRCHIFGENAVHQNGETARMLKQFAQRRAMKIYGLTVADFIKEFGKNYLEDENEQSISDGPPDSEP